MFGQTTFRLPVQNDHMSEITTIPTLINSWLTVHRGPMKATLRFPGCPTNSARNAWTFYGSKWTHFTSKMTWRKKRSKMFVLLLHMVVDLSHSEMTWNDYSDWSSWLVDWNPFNCDHAEGSLVKFGNAGIACEQSGGPKNNGHKTKCFLGFKMLKCRTISISACWESLGNRHRLCFMRVRV